MILPCIEKKGRGVSRMYAKVISQRSAKELGGFMDETISKEANIKTDECNAYKALDVKFPNMILVPSRKEGGNFPELHRIIMGIKGWLRGMHHKVKHLPSYLDEYTYHFNRSQMGKGYLKTLRTFDGIAISTVQNNYKLNA